MKVGKSAVTELSYLQNKYKKCYNLNNAEVLIAEPNLIQAQFVSDKDEYFKFPNTITN